MSKTKKNEIKSVVFLGDSGFPIGFAHIQRITLLGRALIEAGCEVRVVCRMAVWTKEVKTHYRKEGVHEGIHYMYTSDSPFRPETKVKRKYQKIKGLISEFFYLKKLKKEGKIDAVILSTMNFDDSLRYKLFSILMGFPIALNLVEMATALERRSSFYLKFGDWLMEKWLLRRFNGAMPISDTLYEYYNKIEPSKPNMKVPVICDYDNFATVKRNPSEPYFLYCASDSFMEVIEFVLNAYQAMENNDKIKLYLLISGKQKDQIELLREEISKTFPEGNVQLFSNVPYSQLMQLFTNANALLIPLRPTVEDTARFPHKIGEYLATGNPIITTKVGEIKTYFEDGITALVSEKYSINEFAKKMDYVLDNYDHIRKIGLQGKELGLKTFHFRTYGVRIKQFLSKL